MRPVAILDCGTNSTRVLVAAATGATLERRMTITRLGQGVDATGRLAAEAIERTVAALGEFRICMDRNGVPIDAAHVQVLATSAARDAANRDELFDRIAATVGVAPTLLDGHEEGRLSFEGATAGIHPPHDGSPVLVVDIGGGSTELVAGVPGQAPLGTISVDVGCVRLTERFICQDPAEPEDLANAIGWVRDHLRDDVDRELPDAHRATTCIGLAGTVSTLAMLDLGTSEYDRNRVHGHVMSRAVIEDWFRHLAFLDREDRLGNPGMEEGRVDVIVGGLCALVAVVRHYELDAITVSESDILDGGAARLLAALSPG